ncbi:MAG TPA: ORF6N domain-containing protein [Holophagaceae bacterium]|nr:ORF6N domain-containing protein [Holophagaceae bacterium]
MSGELVKILPLSARILTLRGHRVILDSDLAEIYGVSTKRLNEQVKRNADRFPPDFMFRLTAKEKAEVVANCDHLKRQKYSPAIPHAFTEHGAVMAASVLNSPEAVEASVLSVSAPPIHETKRHIVVRAFIAMRDALASTQALARKLLELERKVGGHDETIHALVTAIRELMEAPAPKKRKIGFGG